MPIQVDTSQVKKALMGLLQVLAAPEPLIQNLGDQLAGSVYKHSPLGLPWPGQGRLRRAMSKPGKPVRLARLLWAIGVGDSKALGMPLRPAPRGILAKWIKHLADTDPALRAKVYWSSAQGKAKKVELAEAREKGLVLKREARSEKMRIQKEKTKLERRARRLKPIQKYEAKVTGKERRRIERAERVTARRTEQRKIREAAGRELTMKLRRRYRQMARQIAPRGWTKGKGIGEPPGYKMLHEQWELIQDVKAGKNIGQLAEVREALRFEQEATLIELGRAWQRFAEARKMAGGAVGGHARTRVKPILRKGGIPISQPITATERHYTSRSVQDARQRLRTDMAEIEKRLGGSRRLEQFRQTTESAMRTEANPNPIETMADARQEAASWGTGDVEKEALDRVSATQRKQAAATKTTGVPSQPPIAPSKTLSPAIQKRVQANTKRLQAVRQGITNIQETIRDAEGRRAVLQRLTIENLKTRYPSRSTADLTLVRNNALSAIQEEIDTGVNQISRFRDREKELEEAIRNLE